MLRATLCIAGAFAAAAVAAMAQAPTIRFQFENPQLPISHYSITLQENGDGHFHSDPGSAPPENPSDLPNEGQDRSIKISPAATQRIFATARARKLFAAKCDFGAHVAFTGKKELSYSGPEGQGSCQYNYSRDPQVQWVTSEMLGIAGTLEEGRRLELRHEHGRLGLDQELEMLSTMVSSGQALELGNIAPTLTAIVQDEAVLERAQRRARQLLLETDATDAEQLKR